MIDEKELLKAKIEDLCRRAERYEPAASGFLTPKECFLAKQYMKAYGGAAFGVLYGGYDGFERGKLLVLPAYLFDEACAWRAQDVRERVQELAEEEIVALEVKGSGYRKLSHRDYLGSMLALGLERSVIGDIAVTDESSAVLFCDGKIAPFLLLELQTVGSDKVKVRRTKLSPDFSVEKSFEPVSDAVASPRLDAVVAALANVSREGACKLLASGFVELNYETAERGDKQVPEGAILSIRGHGKYVIESLSGLTKKGRCRLLAKKYR